MGKARLFFSLIPLLISVTVLPSLAVHSPELPARPDLDVRLPVSEAERGGFILRQPTTAQAVRAEMLRQEVPGLTLRWDGISGAPKWIAAPPGLTLSGPTPGLPEDAARAFLRSHAGLFGLEPREMERLRATDLVPAPGGGAHVYFTQRTGLLEVFGGQVNVNLEADGSVRSMGARLFAGVQPAGTLLLSATDAVGTALADVYPWIYFSGEVVSSGSEGEWRTVYEGTGFGHAPEARLLLFPEAEGARLAWEVRVAEPTLRTDYHILVDAADGRILFRKNATLHAQARVLGNPLPQPETEEVAPASYLLVDLPDATSPTPQSPDGWIDGAGTSLEGNNTVAHMGYWTSAGLAETSGVYDYPYDTAEAALVNAWYWVNDAHDRYYDLGFDESAGNFQSDNFGQGGQGNDPIQVVFWTAGGRNNAFFSTSRDGAGGGNYPSTINFFWTNCLYCGEHDTYPANGGERTTAFMRNVVYHEYGHGVTTRRVGGPDNNSCLWGVQSGGMGEGWSDIFAANFLDDPQIGAHFFEGFGLMRDARHDLVYDDLCAVGNRGCQVHDNGWIWMGTLWDLRESMQALDPAGGVEAFGTIVVEALPGTACRPTMLDARDGILDADTTLYGSAHHQVIWNVFANRRMGENASSTGEGDTSPTTDDTVPTAHVCTPPAAPSGLSASATGSNEVTLSYTTGSGTAAVEIWREELTEGLADPARIGFTDDPGSYVDDTVQGGRDYRYHVVALGGGGLTCRSGASGTDDATATGTCEAYPVFVPDLQADDTADCAVRLSWDAAQQGCPGAGLPVVYNVYRAEAPGFEPSDRLLIGRTTGTSFVERPPQTGPASYYLVLAQHGTLDDPPDHRYRGSSQVYRWVPRVPATGRTTLHSWDFDSGAPGWTTDNSDDPDGSWVRVDPDPTYLADALLAPDEAAGGTGLAWVTGNATGASVTSHDSDGENLLTSPTWDGTGGATLLSFDYWCHVPGNLWYSLMLDVDNGSDTVSTMVAGFKTTQRFAGPGRHGWQRAQIDLATLLAPSSTMSVTFRSAPGSAALTEFGVDNVQVEQATVCGRSGLLIDSVSVDDGQPGWGNDNGVLEPGETARLAVTLDNSGDSTAYAPVGTITTDTAGVLIHEESAGFPDIPPGSTGTSTGDGFTVTLPDTSGCGDTVFFLFEFTDASGTLSRDTWVPESGTLVTDVVFSDDFEDDLGWSPSGPGTGEGIWQRGDPVGTTKGPDQANPEDDSPNDAGSQCYVTENGPIGGGSGDNDVDATVSSLYSPPFDLTSYKRARFRADLWFYDNSSSGSFWEDYGRYGAYLDDGLLGWSSTYTQGDSTSGWMSVTHELTEEMPLGADTRLFFEARDQQDDHVVEMGVDHVRVEGDRQVCDLPGIGDAPNGVGDTLRVSKSSTVDLQWTASPVDPSHDAAAYYRVYVSSAPDSGFAVPDTATLAQAARTLDLETEFYKITAVNAAGTSGDAPLP